MADSAVKFPPLFRRVPYTESNRPDKNEDSVLSSAIEKRQRRRSAGLGSNFLETLDFFPKLYPLYLHFSLPISPSPHFPISGIPVRIGRGRGYRIFVGDTRLAIPRYGFYTYPDLRIVRERPIYENDRKTILANPTVIVEVLSRSTRNYDRGDKFEYYRSIPGFEEYILIDPYRFRVEQFSERSPNEWLSREIQGENEILSLSSIECSIPLGELYEEVEFTGEEG